MNRYPLWKYIVIAIALVFGMLYTLPNFFGEAPALQVGSLKATIKVDTAVMAKIESALQQAGIAADRVYFDANANNSSVRVRLASPDAQFNAKNVIEKALNTDPSDPTYVVALNLLSNTPSWLQSLRALPMYLGLDLRGGVHLLLQVDTKAAYEKRLSGLVPTIRTLLRDKNVRHAGIERSGNAVEVKFRDPESRAQAKEIIASQQPDVQLNDVDEGGDFKLVTSFKPQMSKQIQDEALKQNIAVLSKRVNELGVSEPVIQQQGADRIVVQLAGVQDPAAVDKILGRTATLELRMVDETVARGTEETAAIPFGSELFKVGQGAPVVVSKEAVITGDYISSASASFDENHQPAVSISLNGDGGSKMRRITRDNINKRMAIILFEKGKGEVLTAPSIRGEFGSQFQITGMGSPDAAGELALLLRSGSLAAPMEIIEKRTIGPQLGADNIQKGFNSTLYGFAAIAVFMIFYYMLFGFFSVLALSVNLLLLVALLSCLQATLTLPGIAAIALALGMAIDSNVLINERIREELRNGNTPQAAIAMGFQHAWATILDSNVTTLIAGVALLIFGSGAIRGFAVVHCLGILTSIFSSVFISRGFVNLWYGRKKKLTSLAIGQIWKPAE
ncbi:protein translocase subunit SecD [Undibacterium arcticum]|uniref:Protein translocase subunit SecD n=1 Tax=Undibacterium arcticum TaxID=1762892 RepID=A0ABV7F7D6_9BURK